jgi:beta-lactamase regulating signal transducer with metallopeptidase domain
VTRFAGWVSPETMRLIGMSLLHFLWQGLAIAAATFVAMSTVRRPSAKYVVAVTMLAVMMAAPVLTFIVLTRQQESTRATVNVVANAGDAPRDEIMAAATPAKQIFDLKFADTRNPSSIYLLWFVEVWFVGVVLLSLRPAAGFFLIERLRIRKGTPVVGALRDRCLALQQQLGLNRVVRYCESLQLEAPAVVGWFGPVILLPVSALTGLNAQQLEAVIAHELAHVKRLDAFVNLFQIAAETLLFYHPAVWWVSKRIRAERENCCDDVVISICGNAVEYARALATMAEWQSAPALAMAANRSPLAERVARLLGLTKINHGLRGVGIAGSVLCLCASVLAGNALLGAAQTNKAGNDERLTPVAQREPEESRDAVIVVRPAKLMKRSDVSAPSAPTSATTPVPAPEITTTIQSSSSWDNDQSADKTPEAQEKENKEANTERPESERKGPSGSYIDGLRAEGITDLSVEQLIAMRVQNVTPEYVHSIHALGLKPDAGELIAMRIQGVTPDLIRELRNTGLALEISQIIAMRVQGVTPEYVKQFHDMFSEADVNNLIAMKAQGIDGDYVREMRTATGSKLPLGQLIAMKVQGVSPEYVQELKGMGFELEGGDIIGMKVQGVTPEYVKGLRSAGLQLNAHTVVEAKVMGITPEFIERARKHGFQNLSMDKLLALKNSGVLDE